MGLDVFFDMSILARLVADVLYGTCLFRGVPRPAVAGDSTNSIRVAYFTLRFRRTVLPFSHHSIVPQLATIGTTYEHVVKVGVGDFYLELAKDGRVGSVNIS